MPPGTRPTFYGAFRESNALHLEILALAPQAGVPIEFDVYDRDSPATMLATLEAAREKRFNPMLGDYGAGSFVINRNEPKATEEHLRAGNFIKVRLGGVYRFVWVIEDVDWTELARDEKGAEDVKVTGKGAMARLNDATMWVESFLGDDPIGGKWDLGAAGTGNARGDMLRRALAEALARPDGSPIGWISLGWPYGADSQGAVWTDENELVADVGLELGRLWEQLTALGLESEMTPDYEIRTYQELGRHFEPPPTGNGTVTFLRGRHLLGDWHERRRDARKTRLIVKGADGVTLIVSDTILEAEIGRKEGSVSFSNTSDPDTLQRGGRATIESLKAEQQALELPMAHDALPGGLEPYVHYRPGDWVGLEQRDGTIAPHRIVGLRFEELPNSYALVVQLNSRRVEALVRLKRMIDALGGGSAGGGTASGAAISSGGSSGGGGSSGDGKVAAAAGDTPAYLYDQLVPGPGIGKQLLGAGPGQAVQLSLELDAPPDEDDVPAWDDAAGTWTPRPRAAAGGSGAEVRRTAVQNIPNAAWTAITWQAEEYDGAGYWSGANPTRLTFATAGRYLIAPGPIFAANAVGDRYWRVLRTGDAAKELALQGVKATAADTRLSGAMIINAAAGDYVTVEVFQDSGGALNLQGAGVAADDLETTRVFVTRL